MIIPDTVFYEQPLNELIRVCLRLEQLFVQIDHYERDETPHGTRSIVTAIINILHLLDRPDLKAKLAKELSHQVSSLLQLEGTPAIDKVKLNQLLHQLNDLVRCFIDSSGKIGQPLRDIELLNNLRLHLASPGGGCSFDIPVYHYWLMQPFSHHREITQNWMKEFSKIRLAIDLLLKLIREGSKLQTKTAEKGFYQELLDPQINLRLIRVFLAKDIPAYPEISVGRHFLSVRFYNPTIHDRPTQNSQNISFGLSYCTA
jgi:cell division protein ZapD